MQSSFYFYNTKFLQHIQNFLQRICKIDHVTNYSFCSVDDETGKLIIEAIKNEKIFTVEDVVLNNFELYDASLKNIKVIAIPNLFSILEGLDQHNRVIAENTITGIIDQINQMQISIITFYPKDNLTIITDDLKSRLNQFFKEYLPF